MSQPPPVMIVHGRMRAGGGLAISVNRSWQVPPGPRPVAAFIGLSPLAEKSGEVLAAVAAHEAFWLGFEVEDGRDYAVLMLIDGKNPMGGGAELERAPPNFLLLPDQPWLDCVEDPPGHFAQLLPPQDKDGACRISLNIYSVPSEAVPAQHALKEPQPLYAQGSATPHVWSARSLTRDDLPCIALLDILVVAPERFERESGEKLPAEFFTPPDGAPPPPHNPFA
jgi:hypothetical protein